MFKYCKLCILLQVFLTSVNHAAPPKDNDCLLSLSEEPNTVLAALKNFNTRNASNSKLVKKIELEKLSNNISKLNSITTNFELINKIQNLYTELLQHTNELLVYFLNSKEESSSEKVFVTNLSFQILKLVKSKVNNFATKRYINEIYSTIYSNLNYSDNIRKIAFNNGYSNSNTFYQPKIDKFLVKPEWLKLDTPKFANSPYSMMSKKMQAIALTLEQDTTLQYYEKDFIFKCLSDAIVITHSHYIKHFLYQAVSNQNPNFNGFSQNTTMNFTSFIYSVVPMLGYASIQTTHATQLKFNIGNNRELFITNLHQAKNITKKDITLLHKALTDTTLNKINWDASKNTIVN